MSGILKKNLIRYHRSCMLFYKIAWKGKGCNSKTKKYSQNKRGVSPYLENTVKKNYAKV